MPEMVTLAIGVAAAKILIRAAGHGEAANNFGDAAGAFGPLLQRLREPRGVQRVGMEIARGLDEFIEHEFRHLEPRDRDAAAQSVAELLEAQLADSQWMTEAAIDPQRLHKRLLSEGGEAAAVSLGGTSEEAFRFLLERSVIRIASLAPGSPTFVATAAAELLNNADEAMAALEELLLRPVPGSVSARDAERYSAEVLALSPTNGLLDRDQELSDLEDWVYHGPGYWRVYLAPPQSGKTALLATFATHPPRGVEVVSFFIRAHQSEANTREAFLGTVLARLAALAGLEHVPFPTNPIQQNQLLRTLLGEAASSCLARPQAARLVLLVDALDEDAYYRDTTRLTGSIAKLLPEDPPGGVRVVVTRRPSPPPPKDLGQGRGVPVTHPLLDSAQWCDLPVSTHATAAFDPDDVAELMRDQLGEQIAGHLAAAGAPLTAIDLCGLLNQDESSVTRAAIEDRLSGRSGRLLEKLTPSQGRTQPSYRFAHDLIHREVLTRLCTDDLPALDDDDTVGWGKLEMKLLGPWRQRIRVWADGYAAREWPDGCSAYLLDGAYPALLHLDAGTDPNILVQLVDTLTDRARLAAIRRAQGTLAPATRQLRVTADWVLAGSNRPPELNLFQLARLLLTHSRLIATRITIPPELAVINARLGRPALALALADDLPDWRALTLAQVAEAFPAHVDSRQRRVALELAKTAAVNESGDWDQVYSLNMIARVYAELGDFDQARQVALDALDATRDRLTEPSLQGTGRTLAAQTLLKCGATHEARAAQAQAWLDIGGPTEKAETRDLVEHAVLYARLGEPDRALDTAARTGVSVTRVSTLVAMAQALADTKKHSGRSRTIIENAQEIADQIPNKVDRAEAMADVAQAFLYIECMDQAAAADELARAAAVQSYADAEAIEDDRTRIETLIRISHVFRRSWSEPAARQAAEAAGVIAGNLEDGSLRGTFLLDVASALAAVGDYAQACATAELVRTLTYELPFPPETRAKAMVLVADVLADAGAIHRARIVADEGHADAEAETGSYRTLLTMLDAVGAFVAVGQRDQARLLARSARALFERLSTDPRYGEAGNIAGTAPFVAQALAVAGEPGEGLELAESIRNEDTRNKSLFTIASALADNGDIERARAVVARGLGVAPEILTRRDSMLGTDSVSLARSLAAVRFARKARTDVAFLILVADVDRYLGAPEEDEAPEIFTWTGSMTGDQSLALAHSFAAVGLSNLACAFAVAITDDHYRLLAVGGIASVLARAGHLESARVAVQEVDADVHLLKAGERFGAAEALKCMARAHALLGEVKQARSIVDSFVDPRDIVSSLASIATALAETGEYEQACGLAEEAVEAAGPGSGYSEFLAAALSHVAYAFAAAGRTERAREILAQSWVASGSVWLGWRVLVALDPDTAIRIADLLVGADSSRPLGGQPRV